MAKQVGLEGSKEEMEEMEDMEEICHTSRFDCPGSPFHRALWSPVASEVVSEVFFWQLT